MRDISKINRAEREELLRSLAEKEDSLRSYRQKSIDNTDKEREKKTLDTKFLKQTLELDFLIASVVIVLKVGGKVGERIGSAVCKHL